jgi:hypothetical protein
MYWALAGESRAAVAATSAEVSGATLEIAETTVVAAAGCCFKMVSTAKRAFSLLSLGAALFTHLAA